MPKDNVDGRDGRKSSDPEAAGCREGPPGGARPPRTAKGAAEAPGDPGDPLDLDRFRDMIKLIFEWMDKVDRILEDLDCKIYCAIESGAGVRSSMKAPVAGPTTVIGLWSRGARSVRMRMLADGTSWVSIDGCPEFVVSRKLSALLRLLLEAYCRWVSTEDLQSEFMRKFNSRANRAQLTSYFRRLRNRLRSAGVNPFYIERRRNVGARFLLDEGVEPELNDFDEVA
jgi:hypothetical protein